MIDEDRPRRSGAWVLLFVVGLILVVFVGVPQLTKWFRAGEQKPELLEAVVPLTSQMLVLVDDTWNGYEGAVRQDLTERLVALGTTEQMCMSQVLPDKPVWTSVTPCLSAVLTKDWKLPEFGEVQPGSEQASQWAVLTADLRSKQSGQAAELGDRRVAQIPDLRQLLVQLPLQPFRDLEGSMERLIEAVRKEGLTTTLVVYSGLVRNLQLPPDPAPTAPSYLKGIHVKVVYLPEDGFTLENAQAEWDPWFQSGQPAGVEWLVLPRDPEARWQRSRKASGPKSAAEPKGLLSFNGLFRPDAPGGTNLVGTPDRGDHSSLETGGELP